MDLIVKKITLIGHLAFERDMFDGQTVKTRTVYAGLKARLGNNIITIDTYEKSKPVSLFFKTLKCLHDSNKIIIMLSRNGLRFFLPILYLFVRLHRGEVYHCVIGGNDEELLRKNPRWVKYLSSFHVNWYESKNLVAEMKKIGILNAKYLPNFKDICPLFLEELKAQEKIIAESNVYRFCTFSRVTREKGISDAILAVERLHKENHLNVELDIYGPIDESYRPEFETLLRSTKTAKYKGAIDSNKSVEILKDYYGLLFPTFFYGEGFPGTLIDAMCAGVPVIASDWHFNAEIISDGRDGIVYGNEKYITLYDALLWSIRYQDRFMQYRCRFWEKSKNYLVEKNIDTILQEMKVGVKL